MTNSHGHVTIRDKRPPQQARVIVGQIYNIVPPAEPEDAQFSRVNLEPEDIDGGEVEAKVVKGRRGRRPVVTSEVAETE